MPNAIYEDVKTAKESIDRIAHLANEREVKIQALEKRITELEAIDVPDIKTLREQIKAEVIEKFKTV